MDNTIYKNNLKTKKIKLIETLNLLGNNVAQKIKEKSKLIENLEINSKDIANLEIESYKKTKNKEFDDLKKELNSILNDVNNIITNVTK